MAEVESVLGFVRVLEGSVLMIIAEVSCEEIGQTRTAGECGLVGQQTGRIIQDSSPAGVMDCRAEAFALPGLGQRILIEAGVQRTELNIIAGAA